MCIVIIEFLLIEMQIKNNKSSDNYIIRVLTVFIRKEAKFVAMIAIRCNEGVLGSMIVIRCNDHD